MGARWGVMGTGSMAGRIVEAIVAEGGSVAAVSSADRARAEGFAQHWGIPRSHGGHHELLEDGDLDVVHVATTGDRHHADAMACIDAGVGVVVEKTFMLNHVQAEEVVAAARAAGVFLMEAMWMRFQPGFLELQRRIDDGEIGTPQMLMADLGVKAAGDRERRRFSLHEGGGALLDTGIYPLSFAISVLGEPTEAHIMGELAPSGVDTQAAITLRHQEGLSALTCSFVADTGMEATVAGSEGSLRLHAPFINAPRLSRRSGTSEVESMDMSGADLGYRYEVREVHRCLRSGETESPVVPFAFTLSVQRWMDELRRQIGVVYPEEAGHR